MAQTKGEYRVGIDFNPSGDDTVAEIKRLAADLIDLIDGLPEPRGPRHVPSSADMERQMRHQGEVGRLKALAQTAIEDGAMWAVKAATKQEPKL